MTTETMTPVGASGGAPARSRRVVTSRVLIVAALGLAVLSLVRIYTGATDLTSTGAVGAALAAAVPIGLACS